MIIQECKFISSSRENDIYIWVKYNVPFSEHLRVVKKEDLKIKTTNFIGLKRNEAIQLDISKIPKNSMKLVGLFSNLKIKEIYIELF